MNGRLVQVVPDRRGEPELVKDVSRPRPFSENAFFDLRDSAFPGPGGINTKIPNAP